MYLLPSSQHGSVATASSVGGIAGCGCLTLCCEASHPVRSEPHELLDFIGSGDLRIQERLSMSCSPQRPSVAWVQKALPFPAWKSHG